MNRKIHFKEGTKETAKQKKKIKYCRMQHYTMVMRMILLMTFVSLSVVYAVLNCHQGRTSAAQIPNADTVMQSYRDNPYIRFYEGNEGIAWTTIHPGGYAASAYGTYIYAGAQSIYRGVEGTVVIPSGVVSRKEMNGSLAPGHHYYSAEITNTVIPVGKWVLMHRDAQCIHGPFEACRDYEYYGVSGLPNHKCRGSYDSGWIAYCADCGEPLTGYVYTNADCVSRIGYIFAGSGSFAYRYPVNYLFFCPLGGDNLENDVSLRRHMCNSFVSCNRYNVIYNGNGATSGSMQSSVFYFGGESVYEGRGISREENLRGNSFSRTGYVFCGWSDSSNGQVLFSDRASCRSLESYFTNLRRSGEGSDDQSVTLYAVWQKVDTMLRISGGSFNGNQGSYNGVQNGSFRDGINIFRKGYMDSTYVSAGLLGAPRGYRVEFNPMEGSSADPVYSACEFAGWKLTGSDGSSENVSSSGGNFTYRHSSAVNGYICNATASWRSGSIVLPESYCQGMVFEGWYTSTDFSAGHFAGRAGDLFLPVSDTTLYAAYSGISLIAAPDYMGDSSYGEARYSGLTRLTIPERTDMDVFKYYISPEVYPYTFREAATQNAAPPSLGRTYVYSVPGQYSETVIDNAGIYSFELWGARGADYDRFSGEKGDYQACSLFLNEGDRVGIYTGIPGSVDTSSGSVFCGGGEGSYISVNGRVVISSSGGKGASYSVHVSRSFDYTGCVQSFTAEADGDYELKVWGAEGGMAADREAAPGLGGYASGTVHLNSGNVIYICVGGSDGYNGGGSGGANRDGERGGNGGGATHISAAPGVLSDFAENRNLVYIAAGGGGGAAGSMSTAGDGGGEKGGGGRSPWPGAEQDTTGGNQYEPGTADGGDCGMGAFGMGGSAYSFTAGTNDYPWILNGGGGGGWFGGGAGYINGMTYGCGGGGGSGYTGGVANGEMRNGERRGNGYATIECNESIEGQNPRGYGTGFDPGTIPYRDHRTEAHENCVYPAGDDAGNGYCIMRSPSVRYYSSSSATVVSPDRAAPDAVDRVGISLDTGNMTLGLFWDMPFDNGTSYSYMARSYRNQDLISGSRDYAQTKTANLCITTGVYSYYYVIDTVSARSIDYVRNNGTRLNTPWTAFSGSSSDADFVRWFNTGQASSRVCRELRITPDGTDKYIHIVAVDRAGNISNVLNAPIDGNGAFIPYPVYTGKLRISASDSVYAAPGRADTYYVRADGRTVFSLEYSAYIRGYARSGYQIDSAFFNESASEYARLDAAHTDIRFSESLTSVGNPVRTSAFRLQPSVTRDARRSEYGRNLLLTEGFITSNEGSMFIYPSASATLEAGAYVTNASDRIIKSSRSEDVLNGLTLIGDATGPVVTVSINGGRYVSLPGCDISNTAGRCIIDRRKESVVVDFRAVDAGSGLKGNFHIRVVNLDNGMTGDYESTGDHFTLELKPAQGSLTPAFENMLFNGKFMITVTARDNVGNEVSVNSERVTELDIKGRIVRCLDSVSGPLTGSNGKTVIKRGESGYVTAQVWGYPDAVLVTFEDDTFRDCDVLYLISRDVPSALSGADARVIRVARPDYVLDVRTDFTIPLDYDRGVIKVKITAVRGGEVLTWETSCDVISEGTVLDELITVLR